MDSMKFELEKWYLIHGKTFPSFLRFMKRYLRGNFYKGIYTVKKIPMYYEDMKKYYDDISYPELKNAGIVITGIPIKENEYTYNTLLLYRKLYPNVPICISVWDGYLDTKEQRKIKALDIDIVSEKDTYSKLDKGHLANQIVSTRNGIKSIEGKDVEYIFKVRSDIRILKPDFLCYFMDILEEYESVDNRQNKRLLTISFENNLINIPFHIEDLACFGSLGEIKKLYEGKWRSKEEQQRYKEYGYENEKKFDADFQKLIYTPYKRGNDIEWAKDIDFDFKHVFLHSEEARLFYQYAKKYIGDVEDEDYYGALKKYRKFIRDYISVVDMEEMGIHYNNHYFKRFPTSMHEHLGLLLRSYWIDMQKTTQNESEEVT